MSNFWDTIARSTVRELAKAAGLRVSSKNAVADLTETYGPTPDQDFVNEFWFVLRDGWLTRDAPSREALVARMRALERGNMSIGVASRAGQIKYLRTLRRGPGLNEAVLEVFLEAGAEARIVERSYIEPPANAEEQRERFLTAIRDQWLAIGADTIESFERAVFDTVVATMEPLTVPIDDPAGTAARVTATVMLAFIDPEVLQPETTELQDYQHVIVERLADRIPDLDAVEQIIDSFACAIEMAFADRTATLDFLIEWAAAVFMANLAYPGTDDAPEGITGTIAEAQSRFYDEEGAPGAPGRHPATQEDLDFDELLIELMEGMPNCTAPTQLENGALAWRAYFGSAIVNVFRDPPANPAPPLIRFTSPLIADVELSQELLMTINALNADENILKFYWDEDTVWLEQEFHADLFRHRLFFFSLQIFGGAADHFDTRFRDSFGGTMASDDQKAEFDV